jgi:hypothetical protein
LRRNCKKVLKKFYEKSQENPELRPILKDGIKVTKNVVKFTFVLNLLVLLNVLLSGLITTLIKKEFVYPIPIFVPFVDHETKAGYALNFFITFLMMIAISILHFAADAVIIMHDMQTIPMMNVLCHKFRKFGEELMVHDILIQKNRINENKLLEIIDDFCEYDNYVSEIQYGRMNSFIFLLLNSLGIGVALMFTIYESVPLGVVFVIFFVYQVATPCIIGAIIEKQNEKLLRELHNFPWYLLSIKSRKNFVQFILFCQNSTEYNLIFFGKINMELFLVIMHQAYSYLMIILNLM